MIFFSLILLIGTLTSFTDLKNKKIYNNHLIITAVLGLIATAYAALFNHEHILYHTINVLVAFPIGWIMYRSGLWKGGDAKLFTLYAYLMPPPSYSLLFFPGVINLFACSFIAGTLILMPFFIKDILINYKSIASDFLLPPKNKALFRGIMRIFCCSWISFPFYYFARISNSIIILAITYLFFIWGYGSVGKIKKHYMRKQFNIILLTIILAIGMLWGFFMRLWLFPNSLSFPALTHYFLMLTLFTTISIFIHTTFNHFKDYKERIPFAPLFFIGCLLSYTPFLTKLMPLLARWNILLTQ